LVRRPASQRRSALCASVRPDATRHLVHSPAPVPATWANVGACVPPSRPALGRATLTVRPSRRPAGPLGGWVCL
jgi:hypothetical protein